MLKERKTLYAGRIVTLHIDRVELPNGAECELEVVKHPGGAAIVALDEKRRICILRQYRHAANGWIWELPAGKLEPQELPQTTAQRELLEEAGVVASRWESLGTMLSSPSVFSEIIHLFLARDLNHVPLQHEVHEAIEVHWLPFDEVFNRAVTGEIRDAKTLAGLLRARGWLERAVQSPPLAMPDPG